MRTVTQTFQKVFTRRTKTGTCPVCGKTSRRQREFVYTINPFNKNPDGTIKSYEQVREDVNREADAWKPDFTHMKCMGSQDPHHNEPEGTGEK